MDEERYLEKANVLASELITLCRAMGKPLAGDFVQAGIDYLSDVPANDRLSDRRPLPTEDRFPES